ncbi:MAG: hypothetical protein ACI9D0_002073, partial [Bacteroidia bacterium]
AGFDEMLCWREPGTLVFEPRSRRVASHLLGFKSRHSLNATLD